MWVPPEDKDPIQQLAPTRKTLSVFGAVRVDTGRLITMTAEWFNAETFQSFLEYLLSRTYRKRRIIVVLDNSRYHHAKMLDHWLEEHKDVIELEFLPPYSPDLNVIERVWKLTRRLCTHNHYFPTLEDLAEAVTAQLKLWEKPNSLLRRLCAII